MEQPQSTNQTPDPAEDQGKAQLVIDEMAQCLRSRNQRYLEFLEQSGDPAEIRSKVLAKILDSVADGLIVLDDKLSIVLANVAAARMAGWQLEDMSRDELRRNYQFFRKDGKTPLPFEEEPIVVATREKRTHEMEGFVVSRHLPGPGRWIRAHAAPLFDKSENILGGVTVFSDITERLRLQHQRDCLAALIAHDLKNHLAAEQMFFEFLKGDSKQLDVETLKIIESLEDASKKFLGIADSLLEVFRANFFSNTEGMQEVDVVALLPIAIEMSSLEAIRKHIAVKVEVADSCPKSLGLPGVICHVFHNIIQNAVEVSTPNSEVNIFVDFDADRVFVKVTDSGEGMSPQALENLFSPARVAGKVPITGHSSGFGLYLSQMLIQTQGGNISCLSVLGEGTTLTVSLPVCASSQ